MSVYVDTARNAYGRMKMSHMLADTLTELHAMADRIGIQRKWFQSKGTPHYDICQAKRKLALEAGAIAADRRKVVELIRKHRSGEMDCHPECDATDEACASCPAYGESE
jgi:hypothetical protein